MTGLEPSRPKAVVTIVQCRRAVLPYFFVRYALPIMRARFPGSMEVVIIQHRADVAGGHSRVLQSLQNKLSFDLVRQFTEEGRYEGAEIIPHEIVHPPYPSIPSYHLAVKAALDRQADFHVWLEDDALIVDPDCGRWDELLGPREIGAYTRFHALNSAYLVTRRRFAERIVGPLSRYEDWHPGRRIEVFLRRSMRSSRTYLERAHAVRHHRVEAPFHGLKYVAEMVRRIAPEEAHLLDLEFGEGTAALPPVTPEEFAWHEAKDGTRPMDRLRILKVRMIEAAYRAVGR